ncbi:MAG TPA: hypothetical protein VFT06_00355 [Flavisolibacter sp.]|nr:hypothetical protein [Flavisolibacter sp.]
MKFEIMMPNYYPKDEWFDIVYRTLVEHGYKPGFTLCPKAWGELFEMNLHPVAAICTMEELPNLRVAVCYSRVVHGI